MFFRREKPHVPSFDERVEALRQARFSVQQLAPGRVRVSRGICAAGVEDVPGAAPKVGRAGVVVDGEIAEVEHGGYQMFLRTPNGKRVPALAQQLKALHAFEEDLREALGLLSLYNLSLGTIADRHMYDRVEDRDRGVPHRPWQR
jgi:hypothetical protein